MSRIFYSPAGVDVTATVNSYLQTNHTLFLADLYRIQFQNPLSTNGTPISLFYTSAPVPISVAQLLVAPGILQLLNATYLPAKIQRGQLTYEIGFKDQDFEWTWYTDDSKSLPNPGNYSPTLNFKTALGIGALDNASFWMHRAIFQPNSVNQFGTLLGIAMVWRGMIKEASEITRDHVKLKISSLLNIFQETKVPVQLIQAGCRLPYFLPAAFANRLQQPLNTSTTSDLQFTVTGPTNSVPDHALRDCFMIPVPNPASSYIQGNGTPMPLVVKIRDNVTLAGTLHVYPYEPIFMPVFAWINMVYIPWYPVQDPSISTNKAPGFPFVPIPEQGV